MKPSPLISQKSTASVRFRGVLAVSGAVLVMAACSSGRLVIRAEEPSPTEHPHEMHGPSWEAWRQEHYGRVIGELVDAQQPGLGLRLQPRCHTWAELESAHAQPHQAGVTQKGCQPQR